MPVALPEIRINDAHAPAIAPHHEDDVVAFVASVGKDSPKAEVGTLYYGTSRDAFSDDLLGTNAPAATFLDAMFSQASPAQVIWSPVVNQETPALVVAALDKLKSSAYSDEHSVLAYDGKIELASKAASTIVMKLETVAEEMECRAYLLANQASVADAVTWGGLNTKERVLGVFGGPDDADNSIGYMLGAMFANVADHGRAWGLSYAPVTGFTKLKHQLSPRSGELHQLNNANLMTVVQNGSQYQLLGGSFTYVHDDPQEHITVARIRDHAVQRLRDAARPLLATTWSNERCAGRLKSALAPMQSAGELASFSVVPDLVRSTPTHRYFAVTIFVVSPIGLIDIDLTVLTGFSGVTVI